LFLGIIVPQEVTMNFHDDEPYEVVVPADSAEYRARFWAIGSGLQAIDGIAPSPLADKLAQDQINGKLSYDEVETALTQYYSTVDKTPQTLLAQEADLTATRIAEIIAEPGFVLSPAALAATHGRIFAGIPRSGDIFGKPWAGIWRTEDISKKEPVLGGDSVVYSPASMIASTLDYDFQQERSRFPLPTTDEEIVTQALKFASSIWQIHPFRDGNTRAVATYLIKYLQYLGIGTNNRPFAETAPYFRDALVLDNAPVRWRNPEPLAKFGQALLIQGGQLLPLRPTSDKHP
jgi:fido (protein-threonine AMPylation protein)